MQELQQRAGALREFEAVQQFIADAARVPADHVAHVQLRHLVIGHVGDREIRGAQALHHRVLLRAPLAERETHEDLRAIRAGVAVIELRNAAPSEHLAEMQEAPRLLGNHHRQQRFALAAEIGTLGDVAQPVKVHVRAAVDRHQALAAPAFACRVFLEPGDRQRPGRLDDRARVLEHVLDRGADLVGAEQHDLVHVAATQRKGLLADAPHRHAVGENSHPLEGDAPARLERVVHAGGVLRFDADDFHARVQVLDVYRDAGEQAATADRHEDRIQVAAALAQDLHRDGPLPGDDVGIVEGMHEHQIALARKLKCLFERAVIVIAVYHHLGAEIDHRLDLDGRGGLRNDDRRRNSLRVIAGRGAHHTAPRTRFRQVGDAVVRAAQLEREHRLQILALQQHLVAEPPRQARRLLQRGFDGDVVDARLEDSLYVGTRHLQQSRVRFASGRTELSGGGGGCQRLSPLWRSANRNCARPMSTVSRSLSVWRVMRRPLTCTPLVLLRSSMMVSTGPTRMTAWWRLMYLASIFRSLSGVRPILVLRPNTWTTSRPSSLWISRGAAPSGAGSGGPGASLSGASRAASRSATLPAVSASAWRASPKAARQVKMAFSR